MLPFLGFCVIHILYTECAKIKKKNSGAKGLSYDSFCPAEGFCLLLAKGCCERIAALTHEHINTP